MSHSAWLLSLVLAGVAVCGWAEEEKKDEQKPEQKTEQKAPENTKTFVGQLGKSGQAMASLVTHPEEKTEKPQNLLLFVKQGDAANLKALNELLATKPLPFVTVTGVLAPDGKNVLITAIEKTDPPKKGKKGKK